MTAFHATYYTTVLQTQHLNKTQRTKRSVIRLERTEIAPARTHEASAAAASDDPDLQALFTDFQENIGALTSVAKRMITQFRDENGASQVRDAI